MTATKRKHATKSPVAVGISGTGSRLRVLAGDLTRMLNDPEMQGVRGAIAMRRIDWQIIRRACNSHDALVGTLNAIADECGYFRQVSALARQMETMARAALVDAEKS